jgi:PKD repeat protein
MGAHIHPSRATATLLALLLAGCGTSPMQSVEELAAHDAELTVRLRPGDGWSRSATGAVGRGRELTASLPAAGDGPLTVRAGDAVLALRLEGARPVSLDLDHGRALQADLLPSVDAVHTVDPRRVESFYLLRNRSAPLQLAFQVEHTGLPTVRTDTSGALLFADASGVERLRIPPAFAVDAAGLRRDAPMRFEGGRLTVTLDAHGLQYPILLDPAVEVPIWTQVASTGPSPREATALAYDSVRKRTLLFGGSTNTDFGDTWEWDGTSWTQLNPATSPAARCCAELAFDSARGRVVLFGGAHVKGTMVYSDTWEWDGTNWTQAMPTTVPTGRWDHGITYDAARGVTVMFGGVGPNGTKAVNETWTWDGANWTQHLPATPPAARISPSLTFDSLHNAVVLFGGASQTSYLNDTWTWDGANWSQLAPASAPSIREAVQLSFDSVRGRAVLFGGYDGKNYFNDTWEWDGSDWTQLMPASSPSARLRAGMVFDSGRGRTVLFGGRTGSTALAGDTWEMHTHGEACSSGATCDSGFCVDGVCCETSSCGTCQACNTAASPGVCAMITNTQDPDSCTGTKSCNGSGVCVQIYGTACSGSCAVGTCVNGYCCNTSCTGSCVACNGADRGWPGAVNGLCANAPSATDCGSTCASSTLTTKACDGAGTCVTSTSSCGAYACQSASACFTTCATTAQCAAGANCTAPNCIVSFPLGHACSLPSDCASGHCSKAADGTAISYCTGVACTACQGGDATGACVNAIAGANPNGFCTVGTSSICQPGTCNGAGACTLAGAGTSCGSSCSVSTLTTSACNGAGGCAPSSSSCCPYACGATGCKTSCNGDADCCAPASHCVYGACVNGTAPTITSQPNLTTNAFEPYHYSPPTDRVAASGSQPMRFAASGASGLVIDPISGQLYFTPLASGPVALSVSAQNPWGVDTQSFTVNVGEPQPPLLTHDANATATVGVPYVLNATGALTVTGAQPIAFVKLLGPAELNVTPTGGIDWTPLVAGAVTVSVQAKNPYGSDTYTFTVNVVAGSSHAPPTAVATATPTMGPTPLVVQLDSSGSSAAAGAQLVARSWTFGDGSPPSNAIAPMHTYGHGAYVARLVVQDNFGGTATASVSIQSSLNGAVAPVARIVANPSTGQAPLSVTFSCDCAQAPGVSLSWSFGDGDTSTESAPTHVYGNAGGYQVTLQAFDEATGELGVDTVFITVTDSGKQPPTVRAFADPVAGDAPLTVQFASQLSDPDGKVVSFQWTLGEADTSTDPSPQKTFNQPGVYHVGLRAIDNDGLQSSASLDIQVTRGGVLPPSILSKPAVNATVGVPYRYGSSGIPQARGGRPLTFGLGKMLNGMRSNVPAGMSIDPASGAITWTPTADQVGPQAVTLTVENVAGADFQDFVIQVDGPPKSSGCSCDVGRGRGEAPTRWLWLILVLGIARWGRRRCGS